MVFIQDMKLQSERIEALLDHLRRGHRKRYDGLFCVWYKPDKSTLQRISSENVWMASPQPLQMPIEEPVSCQILIKGNKANVVAIMGQIFQAELTLEMCFNAIPKIIV